MIDRAVSIALATLGAAAAPTIASTGAAVLALVGVLIVLGAVMVVVAVWLVRSTRTDPESLGPLEVMGERRWRRADGDARRARLDIARPPGAPPVAPMVPFEPIESVNGEPLGGHPSVGEERWPLPVFRLALMPAPPSTDVAAEESGATAPETVATASDAEESQQESSA